MHSCNRQDRVSTYLAGQQGGLKIRPAEILIEEIDL
jgi:hypothetical protein